MAGHVRSLTESDRYIPALGHRWLTPIYDTFAQWVMPERALKNRFIDHAGIRNTHRVLDLGAGTGTLTILVGQRYPQARVVGLDGDPQILDIARRKARLASVDIQWDEGLAGRLPYPSSSFDRVLSSLMFHHLTLEDKVDALWEAWRVLRPGGELYILDLGRPQNLAAWLISAVVRHMEETADEIDGLLPGILRQAGFQDVAEMDQHMTVLGTLSVYRGVKPKRERSFSDTSMLSASD